MAMRFPVLVRALLVLVIALGFLLVARPTRAWADVTISGYLTSDGSFTPASSGDTIPLGVTLEIHVFISLYGCDPVIVFWGDGTTDTVPPGGALAVTMHHQYKSAGTYTIKATEACQSSQGSIKSIRVGSAGGLAVFDPSGPIFFPSIMGLFLGLGGLGAALGGPKLPPGGPAAATVQVPPPRPSRPRLKPGIPASMVAHLVSLRDVPVGAPRQDVPWPDNVPRIQMVPGQPTDVFQQVSCDCGGKMGFVAGGWFCLDPKCPHITQAANEPFTRIVHGL